jgi:hypothetical protein
LVTAYPKARPILSVKPVAAIRRRIVENRTCMTPYELAWNPNPALSVTIVEKSPEIVYPRREEAITTCGGGLRPTCGPRRGLLELRT